MLWDAQVPGCFGNNDLIFAGHPMDESRAFEWLRDLRGRQIGWGEARRQLEAYLKSQGAGDDHIREQLSEAKMFLKPWLTE